MSFVKSSSSSLAVYEGYPKGGLDRVIDAFFNISRPRFCPAERAWDPPTDVFETREAIHVKMELAGVREEDIEVKTSDDFLIIRGKRYDEQRVKRENFHLMEIHYGTFERVFSLPSSAQMHNVTATLENGFLHVTIPKDEKPARFRIEIG